MSNPATPPEAFVVRTHQIDDPGALLDLVPAGGHVWLHGDQGFIAWGRSAEATFSGPRALKDAEKWWSELVATAEVRSTVDVPGSGLIALGSFAFDPERAPSRLIVPEVIVGRRDGICWVTTIGVDEPPELAAADEPPAPAGVRFDTPLQGRWLATVASAVARITAGELDKVVLARDEVARFDAPLDVRHPLHRLVEAYPSCWTFHVDGFFGSTPEMLVRRERGLVASRVLAGTIRRSGDDARDLALAGSLARSSKDREEHEYAVRSVVDALEPHCASMNVPEAPYVLHLPNVMHLATDVAGVARDSATALALAAALHPSAAVGGTPRATAMEVIEQIEDLERGPYAGPVGWIDADGDGEWAIGLRSAVLEDGGRTVRLFAGCGIVADSDPASEWAESSAKLIPIRDALS